MINHVCESLGAGIGIILGFVIGLIMGCIYGYKHHKDYEYGRPKCSG